MKRKRERERERVTESEQERALGKTEGEEEWSGSPQLF